MGGFLLFTAIFVVVMAAIVLDALRPCPPDCPECYAEQHPDEYRRPLPEEHSCRL